MRNSVIKFLCLFLFLNISSSLSQWQVIPNNVTHNFNDIVFANENTGFTGVTKIPDSTGIIYKTVNMGANWSLLETVSDPIRTIYVVSPSEIYTVGKSYVLHTTTGGGMWDPIFFQYYDLYDIRFQNASTIYLCGYKQTDNRGVLIRSSSGGIFWNFTFIFENSNKLFCIRFPNSTTGYVCGQNGTMRKVVEGVTDWLLINTGTSRNLNSMYFFNENTGFAVGDNSTLLKTVNGGYPWFHMNINVVNVNFRSIEFYDANTGFICGSNGFIAKTTDGGDNWVQQNSNVTTGLNTIQFINRDTLYCAGNSGKFLRTYTGGNPIGINEITTSVPSEFSLSQNYPNPFNPVTKIRFAVGGKSSAQIFLSVFDVLGNEVAVIVDQNLKPGIYEADWDASSYPSGVYFYKLQAGEFSQTKKMILVK